MNKDTQKYIDEINIKYPPSKVLEPYIIMIRLLLTQSEDILLKSKIISKVDEIQIKEKIKIAKTYINLFFNHHSKNLKVSD